MDYANIANQIKALREAVEEQMATLDRLSAELADSDYPVAEYNAKADKYNQLVDEYRANIKRLKQLQLKYFGEE